LLEARLPAVIRRVAGSMGWKVKLPEINESAKVHPTVTERFQMEDVTQCTKYGAYRPEALRNHKDFRAHY
jgi:hypothetical protein